MPVSLLGQLQRLLAQLPLAADSGVLHVLLEGVTQASFSEPPANTSHQSITIRSTKECLFALLALPICLVQAQK